MTTAMKPFLLAFALIAGTVTMCSPIRADEKPQSLRQYRVIFNCDRHAVCKDAGGDLNQWIENLFGPLEKSHVEALFWCDGAGGNTANYRSNVLEPTGKRSGEPRRWIQKLLDEGHDPPQVVVQEAKKRGMDLFYSFRINDIHDSFTPDELATFKVEHPEWLIGERKYGDVTGFRTSLNFALPEVRELKFRVIEEGLVDYLTLGTGVIDIEVNEFKKLAAPKGVLVYPCLYGWPSKYYPIPPELAAGLALNYWQQGADGIYLFNWFPHSKNNSEKTGFYMAPLLKQLGDPAILREQQPHLMFAADRGRPSRDNPYSRSHCVLPAALTADALKVPIQVGEDFSKSPVAPTLTLRLAIEDLQNDDVVELTLNGKPVKGLRLNSEGVATAALQPNQLIQGRNHATIKLAQRSIKSAEPRTVTALEIDAVADQRSNGSNKSQNTRDKNSPKNVAVVIGPEADKMDRFAASELCCYLDKLFGVKVQPTTEMSASTEAVLLVGSPRTNPAVAKALGEKGWPKLSDQGIVLKRAKIDGKPALVIGGESPVATMWAAYELVERWGVRYLVGGDALPAKRDWSGLPETDVVMEPNMRIRCWRLVNDLADGPVSWSLQENQRFLHQVAKMKYNRIHVQVWPIQPFVHYTFRGMEKPPGVLYFGQKHPIDDDTIGREKFGEMNVFTNPEFVGADSPEELRRRAIGLVRGILKEAQTLGMQTGLSIAPVEWPKEFMKVLPGSEPVHQLAGLTAGPGSNQSMDDPLLREMVATIVRAYIETYPDIDYLHINTPEHRGWTGQANQAYNRLASQYKLADLGTYEELCATARGRTSFPGGGERVEAMLKGDLAFLDFFDSLIQEKDLLLRPGGGNDIKLVYVGVVAELFPVVARMVPPGGEVLSFIDYTASRQLRQRDLLQHIPPKQTPASLIFTLADDNVGVLPQSATGSLHTLMGDLRKNDWSGFYTRYWTVSDQDPTVHYLARASWDASVTPQQAYADQVDHVCGPDAVEPALQAFALLEEITLGLDQHGLGFGFPVPGMMIKHYSSGGLSEAIRQDQDLYRQALKHMEQAHQSSRPGGREYIGCFVGRLRFAVRYLDAADAFGATAVAEKANKLDEARRHIDTSYTAIREALESYVSIVKNHGDLGAVALMNEYCYRPIRNKRKELQE